MISVTTPGQSRSIDGYEPFFGFSEPPFSLAPNPKFLFESASHASALGQVAYALERREPLIVITGEIGTGKTLLCRTVLERLERKTFVSVINDPMLERDDLLKLILQDFGVISKDRRRMAPTTRHDLVHALQDYLASLVPLQAHAVVIIDEAQHLQPDVLEQIRLLSNINDEIGTMLQIILVGQTDLESQLSRPELKQFQQRVSRRVRLAPLARRRAGAVHQTSDRRRSRRPDPACHRNARCHVHGGCPRGGLECFRRRAARDQHPLRSRTGSGLRTMAPHHRCAVDQPDGARAGTGRADVCDTGGTTRPDGAC